MNKTQEVHRPGALKQSNKPHKTGRHRSKGAINNELKGKQTVKVLSKRNKKQLQKEARRNQLIQIRKKKRSEVLHQKRHLGGETPFPICIIPLQEDIDIRNIILSLVDSMTEYIRIVLNTGTIHINVPELNQRFSIVVPPIENTFATLDAAKVANTVLFVTSVTSQTNSVEKEIVDDWGKEIIKTCLAQGLPSTLVAVHNTQKLHIKKRQEYKQSVQCALSKWLPEEKVFELDTVNDFLNVLRRAITQKQKTIFYRDIRPHFLAEEYAFRDDEDTSDFGTFIVTGYLRGIPLSVNDLVHIPGIGNFQMSRMEIHHAGLSDQAQLVNNNAEVLLANPDKQESLESENIPDPMDAEQTWPTKEELAEAEANAKKKIVKLVPKGTSEYQASWIPDEEGESLSACSDNEFDDDHMNVDMETKSETNSDKDMEDDEEYETITVSEAPDEERYDQKINTLEETQAMEKFKEAKLDRQFPDEVDTPQDTLAKIRFQKYRGLESFRTSPWDPKENLPIDYARIIEFADYDRMRKCIYKECNERIAKKNEDVDEEAMPGELVTLYIAQFSRDAFEALTTVKKNYPLIVVGLLPYEQKMSLLNVVLKHSNNYTQPIKSKERLVFQCGFRRFTACPIFSQHTNGMKHKYERYFHPDDTVVASMYAPVIFSPCPILCYIESKTGKLELVAKGNVLSCNPNRIVLKRVVLSGHPFKVHKRSVVMRFMFFNREDIAWFKPIQLRTKYGRKGHIKEPLGTHGHAKCIFNGQLKSQDTILMNLYKRVFPKWTYEIYDSLKFRQSEDMIEEME